MTKPPHRAARAMLLAIASFALTIAAHLLADGTVAGVGVAIPAVGVISYGGVFLLGAKPSVLTTFGVLGISQLGCHLILDIGSHHNPDVAVPTISNPIAMTFAHAAAAIVFAVILAKAQWALTELTAVFVRIGLLIYQPYGRLSKMPRIRRVWHVVGLREHILFLSAHAQRAPPQLLIT